MAEYGFTLPAHSAPPRAIVESAVRAEAAGFDFEVIGDSFAPWLVTEGHAPNAWPVLGAVALATSRVELMTFLTCPTMRYHPAVIAQLAATVANLSDGRFTLGVGAGENISEHPLGRPWPSDGVRLEMLSEAIEIMVALLRGRPVTVTGTHFRLEEAQIWDAPARFPAIGVAVTGPLTARLAGTRADAMLAVSPDPLLVGEFEDAGGIGAPRIGQLAVAYDADRQLALDRAHELARWRALDPAVLAQAPSQDAVGSATRFIRPADIEQIVPCGPDVALHVEAVRQFIAAGFSHVAITQIGPDQDGFLDWAYRELLPTLRAELG